MPLSLALPSTARVALPSMHTLLADSLGLGLVQMRVCTQADA